MIFSPFSMVLNVILALHEKMVKKYVNDINSEVILTTRSDYDYIYWGSKNIEELLNQKVSGKHNHI